MQEVVRVPEIPEMPRSVTSPRIEPPVVFVSPRWEYKLLVRRVPAESLLDEPELNAHGAEGWELVSVYPESTAAYFCFKRAAS